jgi:pyruvate,water dikinase
VQSGAIAERDEIFWLRQKEIVKAVAALDQMTLPDNLTKTIQERKAIWQAEKRVTPPPMLPPRAKILGLDVEKLGPARTGMQGQDQTIKGIGASVGCVTAPACVLHGPKDFDHMKPGTVLVAAITTPAWTPLFAMASAIVTDVGGPLSHSSIVAREYGIPAVLGTGVATARIRSGQIITVDGAAGVVTLPDTS